VLVESTTVRTDRLFVGQNAGTDDSRRRTVSKPNKCLQSRLHANTATFLKYALLGFHRMPIVGEPASLKKDTIWGMLLCSQCGWWCRESLGICGQFCIAWAWYLGEEIGGVAIIPGFGVGL
jgi:hypothetical protein